MVGLRTYALVWERLVLVPFNYYFGETERDAHIKVGHSGEREPLDLPATQVLKCVATLAYVKLKEPETNMSDVIGSYLEAGLARDYPALWASLSKAIDERRREAIKEKMGARRAKKSTRATYE